MSLETGRGILIEGLTKRYGHGGTAVDALKGVNMRVAPGEVVGLIGPSGSGKRHAAEVPRCRHRPHRRTHDAG